MEQSTNPMSNLKWPTYGWIAFLEISFIVVRVLTWLLVIGALFILTRGALQGESVVILLTNYPIMGWAALALIIHSYWLNRLKGLRPTKQTQIDQDIFRYFSYEGRRIFGQALKRWYRSGDSELSTSHMIAALAWHRGLGISLARLGLSADEVKSALAAAQDSPMEILNAALRYGVSENSRISWDDLLRGILVGSKTFQELLASKKIRPEEAVAVVEWTRRDLYRRTPKLRHGLLHDLLTPKRNINRAWSARPTPTLDRFSRNLTELARVGLLTSARVRSEEANEAINMLSRSESNNVVLVGEPGVGKTSIVGDIALKMIQGDIPALKDHKLISLDVGAMIGSGVGLRELFARATGEAASSGNTILFIGNLDQFVKAKTKDGFDLSGILMSALEKGNLQLVATSDPVNYKKYVENKENLERLFARVNILELERDEAILVLEDLAGKVEGRNRVMVTLSAIKAAVDMSEKYIHSGQLPDKAFDLLDAAAILASTESRALVTDDDIETIVSRKTKIPVGEITASEKEKLIGLKEKIQRGFIGQEEALDAVIEALKRARMGVSKRNRPIGNFLFLGPTGVGKTELAKRLAEGYFGDETKMIRLDMSEYQTKESSYRLFGAPTTSGDIALSGGAFTEAVKAMPFAVVLLDEIEKAHPDILNIFLQVLDEGRMTDNLGNTVDFTQTIIIATSNAQARFIQESVKQAVPYPDMSSELLKRLVQENFRPEFVNRFDGVIIFKPLTLNEIEEIAKIKIKKLAQHLQTTQDITLHVSEAAVKSLAQQGYDPTLGARPLERVIRDRIESKVANTMLTDDTIKEISVDEQDIV